MNFKRLNAYKIENHLKEVVRGALIAFFIKILAAGLAFAFNVFVARSLGTEGAGVYFLAFTVVTILSTIGKVGFDVLLVKNISVSIATNQWGNVRQYFLIALLISLIVSVLIMLVVGCGADWLASALFHKPELASVLQIMAVAVLPISLFTLCAAVLQGAKRIASSAITLSVLPPLLGMAFAFFFTSSLTIESMSVAYLLSAFTSLMVGVVQCFCLQRELGNSPVTIRFCDVISGSGTMMVTNLFYTFMNWMGVVLVGLFLSNEEVALFNSAYRTAMLTAFILIAVNSIIGPKFAALYRLGKIDDLEKLAREVTLLMTIIAVMVLCVFFIFASQILHMFGHEFVAAVPILLILAGGQFVNVSTGSVGFLLNMSGNEIALRNATFIATLFGALLTTLLTIAFRAIGTAIGVSITVSVFNLLAAYLVYRKVGILIFPLAKIRHRGLD